MTMELVMVGTGSPLPDPLRAGPSQVVLVDGRAFLVDCGRGALMRLAGAGISPAMIDRLLLTHLHSDHVTDVNDLITTRWITGFPAAPLPVIGPIGTERFVEATLAMLALDISYRIDHHDDLEEPPRVEVEEADDGVVFDDGEVRITVSPTDHRPVHPTVGYRIDAGGRSVVLAGDTVPCEGLDRLCDGADVYVQTTIRDDLISQIGFQRLLEVRDYHSTVADAAQTAARAGVGTLVLTHCVPAPLPNQVDEWISMAAEHFDGEVLLPADLDRVPVG